ncbi:MAG: hypothetical protein ACRDYZ_04895 [Acidimicrobiales bacterium]
MVDLLERRVAHALRQADVGVIPDPPPRQALLAALRHRRARRRRAVAGVVIAAAGVAGGWVALGTATGHAPGRSAATSSAGSTTAGAGAPSGAGGRLPAPRQGCTQVVASGSTRTAGPCVGTFTGPAATAPLYATSRPADRGASAARGSAPALGPPVHVRAGRTVVVELPASPAGSTWGRPVLDPGGAPGLRVARVTSAGGGHGGPATLEVTGVRAGTADLAVTTSCPNGHAGTATARHSCGTVGWSAQVEVTS